MHAQAYPGFYNGEGFTWWEPGIGVWGLRSPVSEAKCEIIVQFLTFSCRKFRI